MIIFAISVWDIALGIMLAEVLPFLTIITIIIVVIGLLWLGRFFSDLWGLLRSWSEPWYK